MHPLTPAALVAAFFVAASAAQGFSVKLQGSRDSVILEVPAP